MSKWCSRAPQAYVKNTVFLINAKSIKDLDDVNSDLNDTLRKSIHFKWKTVETETAACLKVKITANKKNKLNKNQLHTKTNWSENSHGLIRKIVYFKDKDDQTDNSKTVLQ